MRIDPNEITSSCLFLCYVIRAQIGGHHLIDPLSDLSCGHAHQFLRRDHLNQVQIHIGMAVFCHIGQHILGVFHGADHDGHTGFLGDLKHAGTEPMELPIRNTDPALREDTDGNLILLQQLDAAQKQAEIRKAQ